MSSPDLSSDLIPLIDAREVRTSEPAGADALQDALIKELTSGEPDDVVWCGWAGARFSAMQGPDDRGSDDGDWREIRLVPFEVRLSASDSPESEGA